MYYFTPASDMFETADSIFIYIELAGVKKEDINIEIDERAIEISGVKRRGGAAEEYNFQRMERPFGFFKRIFDLSRAVNRDSISASFNEGLLEIIIPKKTKNNGFRLTSIEIKD
ncbi:MAG: Hsp20/alpha crystallin family protein [bacterium]|jgi:HSP20 family protein